MNPSHASKLAVVFLGLGLSVLTVACGQVPRNDSSRASDIVFVDGDYNESRLTQDGDLIKLDGLPGRALAFYQALGSIRASGSGVKVHIKALSDVEQATVDHRTHLLTQTNTPQSDKRWAELKRLQQLVNLRRDLSGSGVVLYCGTNSSPSGFFDNYGVMCNDVADAYNKAATPQAGTEGFRGFYFNWPLGGEFYPYSTEIVCMAEYRPPTAKLACGFDVVLTNLATYDCATVSVDGCLRVSTTNTDMFPERMAIGIRKLSGIRGGGAYGSTLAFNNGARDVSFVTPPNSQVLASGEGRGEDGAKATARADAMKQCPKGTLELGVGTSNDYAPAMEYSGFGRYYYRSWYSCLTHKVKWTSLF